MRLHIAGRTYQFLRGGNGLGSISLLTEAAMHHLQCKLSWCAKSGTLEKAMSEPCQHAFQTTTRMQVVPQKNSRPDRMYTGHALSSHKCPMRVAQLLRLDCWHDAAACTTSTMPTSWSVKSLSLWQNSEQMSCDPPATQCSAYPTS